MSEGELIKFKLIGGPEDGANLVMYFAKAFNKSLRLKEVELQGCAYAWTYETKHGRLYSELHPRDKSQPVPPPNLKLFLVEDAVTMPREIGIL